MKLSLKQTEIYCFIIASILGVLFHFVYEWSGNNPIAGLFFPVNESTWEHLKLIFFPILITSVLEYKMLNFRPDCFICTKLVSSLTGMLVTVVLFYTYSGVLGKNIDFLNIAIFFIAMASAWIYSYRTFSSGKNVCHLSHAGKWGCILAVLIVILLFFIFTVSPPGIALFQAP